MNKQQELKTEVCNLSKGFTIVAAKGVALISSDSTNIVLPLAVKYF